eukprot:364506-Chlamydomonas_euryale.AAC.3
MGEKPPEEHCRRQAPRVASPPQEKQSWPILKGVQEKNQPSPIGSICEAEDSRRAKSHAAVKNTRTDDPRGAGVPCCT